MNFGYFLAKTADLLAPAIKRAVYTDDAGNVFPINAAEPTQQAALLAAIAATATPAGGATDARLEAVRALLAGTLGVSAASLPLPTGAASDAKLEALRALLAGTLAVSAASLPLPNGAASDTKLEAMRALLAGTLAVLPLNVAAAPWAAGSVFDARNYAGVEIQITAIPTTATFQRSFDNTTYMTVAAQDANYANVNPSAAGFYSLKGGGYLKWTGTATILVRGYN